jgi:hypothetical protein
MPDYSRIRKLLSHRIVIEYDTGARIVGTLATCRPNEGDVQLVILSHASLQDASGKVMEHHETMTVCPNMVTGLHLEEGPSGRIIEH